MPMVLVSRAPDRGMYETVTAAMRMEEDRPAGLLLHAASETEDGSVEIVDVWESDADMRRFEQERLFPAFASAGITEQVQRLDPPTPREPFHFVGPAAHAATA